MNDNAHEATTNPVPPEAQPEQPQYKCPLCTEVSPHHTPDCPTTNMREIVNNAQSTICLCQCHIHGGNLDKIEHIKTCEHCKQAQPLEGEVVPVNEEQKHVANRDANGKFLPGTTGNPHGRPPRDWTWAGLIEKYADKEQETKRGKFRWRELVIKRLFAEAGNGNMQAIREIMDRMDGKPTQESVITASKDISVAITRE